MSNPQRTVQSVGNGVFSVTEQNTVTRKVTKEQLTRRLDQLKAMRDRHNATMDSQIADATQMLNQIQGIEGSGNPVSKFK